MSEEAKEYTRELRQRVDEVIKQRDVSGIIASYLVFGPPYDLRGQMLRAPPELPYLPELKAILPVFYNNNWSYLR